MELFKNKAECYGCAKCAAVCPTGAITMQEDAEGFLYPVIEQDRCVGCGKCREACNQMHTTAAKEGRFYALRCKDEALLQKSTSGGAFSLIAEEILGEGGLVCGACMDENCFVVHVLSGQVEKMRKAKYVQSDISRIYAALEQALQKGKKILFTGTPCQCQAIRDYFAAYEEQIILAALICRGVQSPKLWREYLAYLGKEKPVTFYDFRDKSYCNDSHTVAYEAGGERQLVPMHTDRFSRLYTKCLTLRPSCYSCGFCRIDVPFDFTIGDFWGVENTFPELGDGKGTSLVIVRSKRAEDIINKLSDRAVVLECRAEDAMQPALSEPAKMPLLRKFLFKDLAITEEQGHCSMELILKKYGV